MNVSIFENKDDRERIAFGSTKCELDQQCIAKKKKNFERKGMAWFCKTRHAVMTG